jgi:hypothetical protein
MVIDPKVNRAVLFAADASGRDAPVRIALDGVSPFTSTPVWTQDEVHLWVAGFPGIFRFSPTGGQSQKVFDGMGLVQDSSTDGSVVAFEWNGPATGNDLMLVDTRGAAPPIPFRKSELRIAPNGRWAAWVANDTGTHEVYVSSFPTLGSVRRVSQSGGRQPMWRSDGRELFFLSAANELMAADVQPDGASPKVSTPRAFRGAGAQRLLQSPAVRGQRRRPALHLQRPH